MERRVKETIKEEGRADYCVVMTKETALEPIFLFLLSVLIV